MKRRTYFGTVVWLAFVFSCQVQRIHATFDSPDYLVPANNSDPDITLNMTFSKSDGTEEVASIYLPENHVGELGIFLYTGSTPSVSAMYAEETTTNVDPDTYLSINDTTGAMMLIESFDYDTGMHTYACTAKCDNSVKPFYIYVSDVNDNYPVWDDDIETSLTIPENKKGWVAQYEATDVDTMDQGKLYYSVNQYGYNYFYMNSSTGDLYVENPLDYETLTYLSIVVSCADTADHTIYESVQIFVKDEPDQPPWTTTESTTTEGWTTPESTTTEGWATTETASSPTGKEIWTTLSSTTPNVDIRTTEAATGFCRVQSVTENYDCFKFGRSTYECTRIPDNLVDGDEIIGLTFDESVRSASLISNVDTDKYFNQNIDGDKLIITSTRDFNYIYDYDGHSSAQLTLTVTCSSEATSDLTLLLVIQDTNNRSPTFNQSSYSLDVQAPVPAGYSIAPPLVSTAVTVSDMDATSPNNRITIADTSVGVYKFSFTLSSSDQPSGYQEVVIKPSKTLAYQRDPIVIPIIAVDKGTPQNTGTTTVTLNMQN